MRSRKQPAFPGRGVPYSAIARTRTEFEAYDPREGGAWRRWSMPSLFFPRSWTWASPQTRATPQAGPVPRRTFLDSSLVTRNSGLLPQHGVVGGALPSRSNSGRQHPSSPLPLKRRRGRMTLAGRERCCSVAPCFPYQHIARYSPGFSATGAVAPGEHLKCSTQAAGLSAGPGRLTR